MSRNTFTAVILFLLWVFPASLSSQDKHNKEAKEGSECRKIRSGLSGTIGYSKLFLNDAVRPLYTESRYYNLTRDIFLTVGTTIRFHPSFFADGFDIRLDPEFAKYSYGSHRRQTYQNIISSMDIDVESIKIPVSLQYDFFRSAAYLHPFLRVGLSTSYFITYEAEFVSSVYENESVDDLTTTAFDFSKIQDTGFISAGLDLSLWNWDFTAELVYERGDGITKDKWGDSFLKVSNTTNYYLRLGILF
jgi:hypothetical protein